MKEKKYTIELILPSYFSSITSTFSVNIYNKNIRKDKIEKWKKKLNYY